MDVQDDIAEAEKGNFEAKLRSMNVIINFAPGFLQIFQKLQSTYYVSRDAELFETEEADALHVGFVRVGDTVAVLHNSSSNFARCQLKRQDGLVGWTHAYAPGGQRVLNLREPGTKQIAAIPIEGLAWQIVSKKELRLTTGKGQRVTLTMALPPNMIAEQLEAKVAELASIKAKAEQLGVQAHRQWKSSHSVSVATGKADDDVETAAESAMRPHRLELETILDDVQHRLHVATTDSQNAQHMAEECLLQLGRYPPKAWWLEGLSTAHTDMVIWAEDIANGEATLSPRAVTSAPPFPGADSPEIQLNGEVGDPAVLERTSEAGEREPDSVPEEPESAPQREMMDDAETTQQEERRLPIVTLEEQVYAEAVAEPDPEDTEQLPQNHDAAAQAADAGTIEEEPQAEKDVREDAEGSVGDCAAEDNAEAGLASMGDQLADGEISSVQDSSGPEPSAEDIHAALSVQGSSRARRSDATLRRRREFAVRRKRQLAAQSGPNDYSTVGFSALRDPDVAQLVNAALERDRRVDELRRHRPVYQDIYTRRRRRGSGTRGGLEIMMLPIHLPAQQPSLRGGLDVARAPRAWTLSRPHSREGVHAQASRGAHLSVNIPRPNSRNSVGLGLDSTHWGHNDFLTVQESERNREFAFDASFSDASAMAPYTIGDDLRPGSPLPTFEARPASPSGFGFSAPQRPQSPPSDAWIFDTGMGMSRTTEPDAGAGISRTVPSPAFAANRPPSRARSPDGVGSHRRSTKALSQRASIDAFAPHSAIGASSDSTTGRVGLASSRNKPTNYEMRFFNSVRVLPSVRLPTSSRSGVDIGQRYDALRGLAPRATTPDLPPPIRVENMPEPAPTLPLTLDDLTTVAASSTALSSSTPGARLQEEKPALQKAKPTSKRLLHMTDINEPMMPQIAVRAVAVRAK